jgi:plastocyanin
MRVSRAIPLAAGFVALLVPARAAEFRLHVVDGRGNPVAGAIAWMETGKPPTPEKIEIVQKGRQFIPEVTVIPVGSTVSFPNRDTVQHHVYSFSKALKFDIPLYIGESPKSVRFDTPGVVTLGCNIHDWMAAYVLVLNTTKFARSDAAGSAVLNGAPAGPANVHIWHPRLRGAPIDLLLRPGAVQEVKLGLKPAFKRTPPAAEGGDYR